VVVDASVWVSGLIVTEVHHPVSRRWLDERVAAGDPLIVPTLLLAEFAGAVSRRTGAPELGRQSAQELLALPGLRLVALDSDLGSLAAEIAAVLRLRGADAVYVAVARSLGLPLVTWDREIHARAGRFVDVRQPS
jgi:predicted nucleic acid-binding protein